MKTIPLLFFFLFCEQKQGFDFEEVDRIIDLDKLVKKSINSGLKNLDRAVTRGDLREMIYAFIIVESSLNDALNIQDESTRLAKPFRECLVEKNKKGEIGREEYFAGLSKIGELERISKFSFGGVQSRLEDVFGKIRSILKNGKKGKWSMARISGLFFCLFKLILRPIFVLIGA